MSKSPNKPPQKRHIPTPRQYPPRPPAGPPEVVSPIWLLKAVGVVIAVSLICGYLTLCLLVYQGQWQLVLHPSASTAPIALPTAQPIHFGAAETGQPALTGIWLPSETTSDRTILYLPDGSGSVADDTAALTQLHQLPLNILAFDYRGFGASTRAAHPNQQRMTEDAESAYDYLVNTRHLRPQTIIPYGAGLGASLAASLAARHPELPALIIENPIPNAFDLANSDSRATFVPLKLFFKERFEIAEPLKTLSTPKLLLTAGPSFVTVRPEKPLITPIAPQAAIDTLYRTAHSPSMTIHLPAASQQAPYRESILRFLDEYMH